MATNTTCDVCGKAIHLDPAEQRFRVDLHNQVESRGFDVCEADYAKIALLLRQPTPA